MDARLFYTLGVCESSVELAKRFNADVQKAQTAALLHDIAKYLSNEILEQKLIQAHETDYLAYSPLVWHAPVGAIVAKEACQIEDEEILNSIK